MTAQHPRTSRRHQSGAALIEYSLVTALIVVVLIANPNVIVQIVDALRRIYSSFTYALSVGVM